MGDTFFEDDTIVITSNGEVIPKEKTTFHVTIPSFEVYSNPTIKISDVKKRRFNMIDRSVQKAKQEIMSQEDSSIFDALEKIADKYLDFDKK